jgi:hypothetical protein
MLLLNIQNMESIYTNMDEFMNTEEYKGIIKKWGTLMIDYFTNYDNHKWNINEIIDKWAIDPRNVKPIIFVEESDVIYPSMNTGTDKDVNFMFWNLHLNGITSDITIEELKIVLLEKEPIVRI